MAVHTQKMSAEEPDELKVETGPIAGAVSLVLNRPRRKNALTRSLVLALGAELKRLGEDKSVKVILLRGMGGSFCSGADLTTIVGAQADEVEKRIREFHALITGIVSAEQPVIAVVEGPAVGFGADLALSCDMRIFTPDAYIEEGFIKVGLMPDGGGTYFMPSFVGPRAFEYLALGVRLGAERCEQLGIANRVVDPASLQELVESWTHTLVSSAPLALSNIKRAVRKRDREALESALAVELAGQAQLATSRDFQEGVQAFLEKRKPQFQGR